MPFDEVKRKTLELAHYLPTKFAKIFAMLTNFHLLNLLSQTSPVSGTYKERRHAI